MNKALSKDQSKADIRKSRRRAEDRFKKELSLKNESQLREVGQHLYELRLDQIEIEELSEEFNRLREKVTGNGYSHPLQTTSARGYFFLDREGMICDAKFPAIRSSGPKNRKWEEHLLSECVAMDMSVAFNDFLHKVFKSGAKQSCEISFDQAISKKRLGLNLPLYASINAVANDEKQLCLLVLEDISANKLAERKKELAVLLRSKKIIATAMDGFWMVDMQGTLEDVNEAYAKMSGYSMQELVGMHVSQLAANELVDDVKEHIGKIIAQGNDRFETQHRRKDGGLIDIEVSATFMPEYQKFFVFSHDITLRKQNEQALRVAAATFETHDGILITDAQCNIIRVNRAFSEITGYTAEEVIGKNPRFMSSGMHDHVFYAAMWQHLIECGSWEGEIWDRRKNDGIYPKWMTITAVKNELGETTQYVAIFSDISARKLAEAEIHNLAFYDTLTKLPNRRLLNDRLSQAMAASKRSSFHSAVMFLDLDNFKPLNDAYGHSVGDSLLIEAAERLKNCVREMDTVARFGGDEFVVLISELYANKSESIAQVLIVAEKIRSALSTPYLLAIKHEGQTGNIIEHQCTVSIGVVVFITHEDSQEDILKWADEAMYQAKQAGRNSIRVFDRQD